VSPITQAQVAAFQYGALLGEHRMPPCIMHGIPFLPLYGLHIDGWRVGYEMRAIGIRERWAARIKERRRKA
jgi:hypothetical protein